jgi:hypothetical protein
MIEPLDYPAISRPPRTKAKDRSAMKRSPDIPKTEPPVPPVGHSYEARIRHDLMAVPELEFSSLVVHRIPDGICLEGVVSTTSDDVDVCQRVREVAGVNAVLNHLVMRPQTGAKPRKG